MKSKIMSEVEQMIQKMLQNSEFTDGYPVEVDVNIKQKKPKNTTINFNCTIQT